MTGARSTQVDSGTASAVPTTSSRTMNSSTTASPDSQAGMPCRSISLANGENINPMTMPSRIGARMTSA